MGLWRSHHCVDNTDELPHCQANLRIDTTAGVTGYRICRRPGPAFKFRRPPITIAVENRFRVYFVGGPAMYVGPTENAAIELVERWQAGDESAADELFHRYSRRLCRLAAQQIGRRLAARVEPEDVVQSALGSFFRRTSAGEYEIDHSGALWRLLVQITLNKVRRHGQHHRAGKRDVGREAGVDPAEAPLESLAPTANRGMAVDLVDELEAVLEGFGPRDRHIIELRFQGYALAEIAERAGCARRTVSLVLQRIAGLLQQRLDAERVH